MRTVYLKQAIKALERLDSPTKHRIRQGIIKLPDGDVKRLRGHTDLFRLRVGKWRVLFTMIDNQITIEDVLPRGDAYK